MCSHSGECVHFVMHAQDGEKIFRVVKVGLVCSACIEVSVQPTRATHDLKHLFLCKGGFRVSVYAHGWSEGLRAFACIMFSL